MRSFLFFILLGVIQQSSAQQSFLADFNLDPTAPQSFYGTPGFATFIHSRDPQAQYQPYPSIGDHGPNCEPPFLRNPGDSYDTTHAITAYDQVIYSCKNHMMTNLRADGYGLINIMPDHLVDISEGEATVRVDVSSLDRSAQNRDWWTMTLMPLNTLNPLHAPDWAPDVEGFAPNAIWIGMSFANGMRYPFIEMTDANGNHQELSGAFRGLEEFITPSQVVRDTWEISISKNRIRLGMKFKPGHPSGLEEFWWVDTEVDENGNPLNIPWDKAAVLMGHYVYNSRKNGEGIENTWHWDNLFIEPAVPIEVCVPDARFADGNDPTIRFNKPAPENSFMLFASPDITRTAQDMELSFDQGQNWLKPERLTGSTTDLSNDWGVSFASLRIAVPPGTQEVSFRGRDSHWYKWMARDVYIFSETLSQDTVPQDTVPPDSLDPRVLLAKVFLQGMYDPSLGVMKNEWASKGLLPLDQPFSNPPFLYLGEESLDSIPENTIDWILVELRDSADVQRIIWQQAALLNDKGEITDLNGNPGLNLPPLPFSSLYLSVSHLSSLSILSATPLDLSTPFTAFDFSQAIEQSMGIEQQVLIGSVACMRSGDFDSNGLVNNQDYNLWRQYGARLNQYLPVDADGNGIINVVDFNFWVGNNSKVGMLNR